MPCFPGVGSYPLFPRLHYKKILLFDIMCCSASAQKQLLHWWAQWAFGEPGYHLECVWVSGFGGLENTEGGLWHYTVIIPEHTNILQSIIMGKRAVGSCPLPEAVPWDGRWCLPHWAKAWASLAESVSPFGSALAPAVQGEWMWQRTQEEGREGSLPPEQRLCGTQQKSLYFFHPFMLW